MGYQINALFEDGTLMISTTIVAPTPALNSEVEILRGRQPVRGKIVKIRPLRTVSLHGPATHLDEVHFREVVVEAPTEPARPSQWASSNARFRAFLSRKTKSPAPTHLS